MAPVKKLGRPKDFVGKDDYVELTAEEEARSRQLLIAEIERLKMEPDEEIDNLTASDVLIKNANSKKEKRYFEEMAKGKIINSENLDIMIEENAVVAIKRLKKESKAIRKILKGGANIPDEEKQRLESKLLGIDRDIENEKKRAAELKKRANN